MLYRLSTQVTLPVDPAEVFAFFSDAHNLDWITPPWRHFQIDPADGFAMARGATIAHRRSSARDTRPLVDEQLSTLQNCNRSGLSDETIPDPI